MKRVFAFSLLGILICSVLPVREALAQQPFFRPGRFERLQSVPLPFSLEHSENKPTTLQTRLISAAPYVSGVIGWQRILCTFIGQMI